MLLVPRCCLTEGDGQEEPWRRVDWLLAAFLMLEGWDERRHEELYGPIHSYAFRLGAWESRLWSRAWVNRIALFLREWAARHTGEDENRLFGPRPVGRIVITHDLDAIRKTVAIRIKQAGFNGFNAVRSLTRGQWRRASQHLATLGRFLLSNDNYDHLQQALDMAKDRGLRSVVHVYAGSDVYGLGSRLLDPGYRLRQERVLCETLAAAIRAGHEIGLHPAFASWSDSVAIARQRAEVQAGVGKAAVSHVRQHWLRFAWQTTWAAQAAAGLAHDTTLGFNDRPGLRTSAALTWRPWNTIEGRAHDLQATPLLLMDSQLYDYGDYSQKARHALIDEWLGEIFAVGGTASVLWHTHTLGRDYGWREGFVYLLDKLAA